MLHSTMEMITEAISNSLSVFLICNLIIVILLVSNFKPGSGLDEDSSTPLPVIANKKKNNEKYMIVGSSFDENKALITVNQGSNAHIALIDDRNNNNNNRNSSSNNNNNNNSSSSNSSSSSSNNNKDDDDELRRRVEEFIQKVNKGWRAENLTTHSLVHIKNPQPEVTRICAN